MTSFAAQLAEYRISSRANLGPTTEIGSVDRDNTSIIGSGALGAGLGLSWKSFLGEALEHVPELQWKGGGRGSVKTYHMMRNDAQVQGLYHGTTFPIRRYGWALEPNGAKVGIVNQLSKDYNLPIRGKEDKHQGRSKGRFSFQNHLRHALLALLYGHMYFEQCGEIKNGLWHLTKLAPRMPHSLQRILVDQHGSLSAIEQVGNGSSLAGMTGPLRIPVDKLTAYIWEQEGGNWAGRSMLRGIYKNWVLKDTTLRVGAINIERAGGVPVIVGPKGASPDDLAQLALMARQFRVGEGSGGAIPNGAELHLARAAGGEEAVNFIRLMNDEMARAWLMMFMNLGQSGQHGSFALGSSLIDYVLNTQEIIAKWVCDTFNEHMIEDQIDWNWGEDVDKVPKLVYNRVDDRQLAIADLVSMIDKNLITVDDELESWIREDYSMPRRDPKNPARAKPSPSDPGGAADPGGAVVDSPSTVPSGTTAS